MSSTSSTGRITSTARSSTISPRQPASRSSTTPSIPTKSLKPSCLPAAAATTSSCPAATSSRARSRPACSRSSTSRNCRTFPTCGTRFRSEPPIRPRQRILDHYMWGTVGLGYNIKKVQTGARHRQDRQLDVFFNPDSLAQLKDCGVLRAGLAGRHYSGGIEISRPRPEQHLAR